MYRKVFILLRIYRMKRKVLIYWEYIERREKFQLIVIIPLKGFYKSSKSEDPLTKFCLFVQSLSDFL